MRQEQSRPRKQSKLLDRMPKIILQMLNCRRNRLGLSHSNGEVKIMKQDLTPQSLTKGKD